MAGATESQGPVGKRKRPPYSKLGCFACKFRKKKCDEGKPNCEACERNHLICKWPQPRQPGPGRIERRNLEAEVQSIEILGFGQDAFANQHCPGTPPRPNNMPLGAAPDLCRDSVLRDEEGEAAAATSNVPMVSRNCLGSNVASLRHPGSYAMLQYWVHDLANRCTSTSAQDNPFLTVVVPMAFSNELIMQALLYFSSAHYSNKSPSTQHIMLTHQAQALRGLKFSLTELSSGRNTDIRAADLFLVSYLLLGTEVAHGKVPTSSFHHLKAIRTLLQRSLTSGDVDSSTLSFFVEEYRYLSVLADFSMPAFSDEWTCEDTTLLHSTGKPGLVGYAPDLIAIIPAVTKFACDLAHEREGWAESAWAQNVYTLESVARYRSLLRFLLNWEQMHESADQYYLVYGRIYQHALLLCLQVTFHQHSPAAVQLAQLVQDLIDKCINLFKVVPLDWPVNRSCCWPLVIIGACAQRVEDQLFIAQRLEATYEILGFSSMREARDFLYTVWAWRSEGVDGGSFMSPLDIRNAMFRQQRNLILL